MRTIQYIPYSQYLYIKPLIEHYGLLAEARYIERKDMKIIGLWYNLKKTVVLEKRDTKSTQINGVTKCVPILLTYKAGKED